MGRYCDILDPVICIFEEDEGNRLLQRYGLEIQQSGEVFAVDVL